MAEFISLCGRDGATLVGAGRRFDSIKSSSRHHIIPCVSLPLAVAVRFDLELSAIVKVEAAWFVLNVST